MYDSISCLILSTCHNSKLRWVQEVAKSIEINDVFDQKILAVDEFNGLFFPQRIKNIFESGNWDVLVDNHMSRTKSMLHGIEISKNDLLFYSEDDVLLDLPDKDFILSHFETNIEGRECGILSLNLGGTNSRITNMGGNLNSQYKTGDLEFAVDNKIKEHDNYFSFLRLEKYKNPWFFEFPGIFINKNLLKELLILANDKFKGYQIEVALTAAWFSGEFDKKYYKASIAKNIFVDLVKEDPMKLHDESRLLKNLDKTQGAFIYGGNPTI